MKYYPIRIFYLLIFCLCLFVINKNVIAQTIPNGDFEEWFTGLVDPPFWHTNNIYSPFECRQVFAGYPPYSGNHCIEGVVDTCPQLVKLLPPHIHSFGIPLDRRPEALRGFYKFLSNNDDRFSGLIKIYKNNSVIGEGSLVSALEVTNFTEFIININYTTNDTPDVAIIEFTIDSSLISNKLHQGSKWQIDELYFGPISDVNDEQTKIPDTYYLHQNYPNPFNPSTVISWQSPVGGRQTIKVYDLLGNEAATLVDDYKPAGRYEVAFNAEKLASGFYFYQLKAGEYTAVKKMILIK